MHDLEQAKQELAKAPAQEERLRLLLLHSKEFYRQNPKQAEKWAREALKLATKLKNEEGIARAHLHIGCAAFQLSDYSISENEIKTSIDLDQPKEFKDPLLEKPLLTLGILLSKQGKYSEALQYFDHALRLSREFHRKSEIDILGAMGNAALEQGDYPKALKYQYDSLAIVDALDDPLRRSVVNSNIGWIYLEVHALDKADTFFERSFLIKKEIEDKSGLSNVIYNRGIIAYKRGNMADARKLHEEALKLAYFVGLKDSEAYIENTIGNIELDEGAPKLALKHFNQAIVTAASLNLRTVWCASLIGKGRALVALKKPEEAIRPLTDSFRMSDESGLLPLQCECVSALATAYEATGKLKESVKYFNTFIKLSAEVQNEQKQRELVEISARVEIEKADRERARMEQIAKDAGDRAELFRSETERQSKELTTLALQLVQKNEFLCTLKEEIEPIIKSPRKAKAISERIDDHIKSDRDWETFEHQFDQVHRDFLKKLAASYPTLTPTELKLAILIKLELSTKAIASLLCLSARTVENHRQSIRRKLELHSADNLVSFFTGFGEAK